MSARDRGCAAVILHDDDDVAVMVAPGISGTDCRIERADGGTVMLDLATDVPFGHKVSLRRLAVGDTVRKYGMPIGRAIMAIPPGAHVHRHNLISFNTRLRTVGSPR
ncbi:UxaA family hydrolase [Paracoccus sp. (in: a-proteobacteria)]|uniref:UxaA family hydrolase n=1 Tax=Paracoccus sp. TaxID=267 RepID=UPI003A8399EA